MANKLYWGPADFYCTHTCSHWHSRFSIKDHDCRETGSGNLIFESNALTATKIANIDNTNIVQLYGDSAVFDYDSLNVRFDLIFIDAAHDYGNKK